MTDDRTTERMTTEAAGLDPCLSLDVRFELLAHYYRREILRLLIDSPDHTATLDELVERLVDREAERPGAHPGCNTVEIALHHTHVPKLADAGVIEYDSRSQALRYRLHAPLEALLELM